MHGDSTGKPALKSSPLTRVLGVLIPLGFSFGRQVLPIVPPPFPIFISVPMLTISTDSSSECGYGDAADGFVTNFVTQPHVLNNIPVALYGATQAGPTVCAQHFLLTVESKYIYICIAFKNK